MSPVHPFLGSYSVIHQYKGVDQETGRHEIWKTENPTQESERESQWWWWKLNPKVIAIHQALRLIRPDWSASEIQRDISEWNESWTF